MSSPRWLIGLIMFWLLMSMIGNVVEGADIFTDAQVAQVHGMQQMNLVESKSAESGIGGSITYATFPLNVIQYIVKAITMDFSFLYDVNPVTGANTPNQYYWIWALIWWPVQVGILFELGVLILRILRGG